MSVTWNLSWLTPRLNSLPQFIVWPGAWMGSPMPPIFFSGPAGPNICSLQFWWSELASPRGISQVQQLQWLCGTLPRKRNLIFGFLEMWSLIGFCLLWFLRLSAQGLQTALNQAVQTQTVLVMVQKLKNLAVLLARRFVNGIRSFGNHIHCDDFIQQIQ